MIDWSLYKGRDTKRNKKTYEEFLDLLENDGYKLIGEYINVNTKVKLQCDKGHKYEALPNKFKMGRRCPICSGNHPETSRIQFEELVENEGYKLIGEYVNNKTKLELECNKGHKYFVTPNSFKSGTRCPICAGCHLETAKLELEELVENEGYKLIGEYVNNSTKIEMECDKGHKYMVRPNDFKKGYRCPICSGQHSETAKLEFEEMVENEGYKLLGEYKSALTKVEIQCDKDHKYFVKPNAFKSGHRCPNCNTTSHGERLTRKILEEYKLGFEQQKKFDGLTGLGGGQLSYDFFVEEHLLIEIQGEQHYKPTTFGGRSELESIEAFKQQQEHDKRKREFAINNGYKLLEIPYFSTKDLDNLENTLREELNNLLVLEEAS